MYVLCGLGNPGFRYSQTRHNAGFMLVDRIARRCGSVFRAGFLSQAVTCSVELEGHEMLLLKPMTFMNLSGRAVRELLARFSLSLSDLLIVYDDVALTLGRIRLRRSGSAGGHNGMKSIVEILGTREIARLRIGVAGESLPHDLSEYVLADFEPEELTILDEVLDRAVEACLVLLKDGLDQAMSRFN